MKKLTYVMSAITSAAILSACSVNINGYSVDLDALSQGYLSVEKLSPVTSFDGDGSLNVFFIDVGQGDSTFIELPNGETMLIDAGEYDAADTIIDFINSRKVSSIDYIVATHPHSDHIGGFQYVLKEFDFNTVYLPDAVNNTTAYERMIDIIEEKAENVIEAKAGEEILSEDGLEVEILAPNSTGYKELNDYSAVVKITYENTSFLFMGDAEKLIENEIQSDVSCDVIKVGHHGSKTSSSANFVKRTKADYAVISVGADNEYGLPKSEILKRWEDSGADILRTDEEGTIGFTSDGQNVERIEL